MSEAQLLNGDKSKYVVFFKRLGHLKSRSIRTPENRRRKMRRGRGGGGGGGEEEEEDKEG